VSLRVASVGCICAILVLGALVNSNVGGSGYFRSGMGPLPSSCTLPQNFLSTTIEISGCGLEDLDSAIIRYQSLQKLNLANNKLSNLPPLPPSLKILFLLGNQFTVIPQTVLNLPNLYMLSFKKNMLREVTISPKWDNLAWMILTSNDITHVPGSIGHLKKLRKLMLSNNKIESLPSSMQACTNLELLRLANNKLGKIPQWLLRLPKLAWIALNDNPAVRAPPITPLARSKSKTLNGMQLGRVLGEGTSGVVYASNYNGQQAAVKVYKDGCCSSDGTYAGEVRVAKYASSRDTIDNIQGSKVDEALRHLVATYDVIEHPRLMSVMEFMPDDEPMVALGSAPSLQTVTHDTYTPLQAQAINSSPNFVLQALMGVATAATHLHKRHIMHGDVYAHNILVSAQGFSKLGDFGAAFFYDGVPNKHLFEKIEVRAFGFLIQELAERLEEPAGDTHSPSMLKDDLQNLAVQCISSAIDHRHTFGQVRNELKALMRSYSI